MPASPFSKKKWRTDNLQTVTANVAIICDVQLNQNICLKFPDIDKYFLQHAHEIK